MDSFVSKQILTSQTIGEYLQKARQGLGCSIKEISKKIRINEKYLSAIELGLYSELPGDIYTLEFIKKYAQFLHIDSAKAAKAYLQERKDFSFSPNQFTSQPKAQYFLRKVKWLSRSFFILLFLVAIVYGFFTSRKYFYPPVLEITSLEDYTQTSSSNIIIQGSAKRAESVYINSEPITISPEGKFIQSYDLPAGPNLIKISAKGALGRETQIYKVVFVK